MTTATKTKKTTKKTVAKKAIANKTAPANNAEIRVRIDAKTKAKAEKLFKRYGMTTSAGIKTLIDRALAEKELPRIPNAETRAALEEARAGDGEAIPYSELESRILGVK